MTQTVRRHAPCATPCAMPCATLCAALCALICLAMSACSAPQEQVVAAKPTSEFDSKVQQVAATGDRFVGQLYAELKK